jgi:hypothetical protein
VVAAAEAWSAGRKDSNRGLAASMWRELDPNLLAATVLDMLDAAACSPVGTPRGAPALMRRFDDER